MFNKKQEHPLITLQFLLLGALISSFPPPPRIFTGLWEKTLTFLNFTFVLVTSLVLIGSGLVRP